LVLRRISRMLATLLLSRGLITSARWMVSQTNHFGKGAVEI